MNNKRKMRKVLAFFSKRYGDEIASLAEAKSEDLFELLVSTVLSQRALDRTTEVVSEQLFAIARTPEEILKLGRKRLEKIIRPSGPFRQKAKRLIAISKALQRNYKDSFPRTREELTALHGVGPKTADIVLSYGYGEPVIAVDTHVEVVSKRLGFAGAKAKYEEIRSSLERLVPENERYIVNLGFVNFGKEICIRRKPKCGVCPLTGICAYYLRISSAGRK
jgi:endonuclease-3